jgi:hypothetical protein
MLKANFKHKFNKELWDLGKKHNLTADKILDIYFDQFNFIAKSIRQDEKTSIKLKGLGKFVYNEKLVIKLTELKQLKNEREILFKSSTQDGDGAESNQDND